MSAWEELYPIFETQMKRGTLSLAILAQLRVPKYGYGLLQTLNGLGVDIEAGTLYPLLRRLEKQGILHCDWDTSEARPRKHYHLSEMGETLYVRLLDSFCRMSEQLKRLTGGTKNELD